jgi:hypothetical protein
MVRIVRTVSVRFHLTDCSQSVLPCGTDAAMRSPFAVHSRNQEQSRAMKTNKTIGIGQ